MEKNTKICIYCKKEFGFIFPQGKLKVYCSDKCQRDSKKPRVTRWTQRMKARIVYDVQNGNTSFDRVCKTKGISPDELREWISREVNGEPFRATFHRDKEGRSK